MAQDTEPSQTAEDFIASQLQLEAEAREALPYQFDSCTKPLGPLRQSLFSCLTCNPPSASPGSEYNTAALCYSCSISCHGEHNLVELFSKRDIECDCGTTRLPDATPCTLRLNPTTNQKGGVVGEAARKDNVYNHNFAGRFCACNDEYDPAKEKGTMFQCLGLADEREGGCGEDWWHPECLLGLPRAASTESKEATEEDQTEDPPLPPGFPEEDDFDHVICYKCSSVAPWIKSYAATPGFLPPVFHKQPSFDGKEPPRGKAASTEMVQVASDITSSVATNKRKAEDEDPVATSDSKKIKVAEDEDAQKKTPETESTSMPKHTSLLPPPAGDVNLFVKEDFREQFCRCAECFPRLAKFPQLLEEEESYEPPMSESDADNAHGAASVGSGSTYERGEALLSNVDRVRAIEGVMVYNQLRDKVKTFLQPFAESGQAVSAEDIKSYFEKLRGDDQAIKSAAAGAGDGGQSSADGSRKEQGGY
ncbi:hypothetical protein AAFC00_005303 [Neodothiora populina]|uniref:UBR-type domain-containing protein n=1 Tax=Neodothiora populina TaxID=2781224 RepID=A0ABR3PKF5_9PEZI